MIYIQHRPPTIQILNLVKSILLKNFKELTLLPIRVLDLFCGNGNFTQHLHKYANISYVVGVERDIALVKKFDKYLYNANLNHKVFCLDAFKFKFNIKFDIIFIDPPFKFNMCSNILRPIAKKQLLTDNGLIIMRNLARNKLIINPQHFMPIHSICIGQNQVIFIKNIL